MYPRVPEVLRELQRWDVKLVCGETLTTRKPAPEGILLCPQYFHARPTRALIVGDSSMNVANARNAGVAVWALSGGYNIGQTIADSLP